MYQKESSDPENVKNKDLTPLTVLPKPSQPAAGAIAMADIHAAQLMVTMRVTNFEYGTTIGGRSVSAIFFACAGFLSAMK